MWTIFKVYIYSNIYLHLYTLLQFSTAYCCFYVLFVPTKSTQKALRTENLNVKCLRRFLGAAELAALKQSSHLVQKTPIILLIFLSRTNEQPNDFYLLQQVISKNVHLKEIQWRFGCFKETVRGTFNR